MVESAHGTARHGTVVLAHGAGGHMNHAHMVDLSDVLRGCGLDVVRFNFLYRAAGVGPPDRMPRLIACFEAVIDHVRSHLEVDRLFLAGHSMGGRTASMMLANGLVCDGLILFGYPLHPAAAPDKLRSAHLAAIMSPVLSFNGTRDKLCTPDLMRAAVDDLTRWTQHWVEGGDHGLEVLKRSGRTRAEVLAEISQVIEGWLP